MTTQEVANRYIELEKQGKWAEIQDELYSPNVVSIEPEHAAAMGMQPLTKGLDAIKDKSKAFNEMIEEVKGLATIRGYRNLPKGDVTALARTIAAFSTLAHADLAAVSEAEINPLLVKKDGEGVIAVDGLVVLKR